MGIPDEPFWAPEEVVNAYRTHSATRASEWLSSWSSKADSSARATLEAGNAIDEASVAASLPVFDESTNLATRQAFQKVLEATVNSVPNVLAGAADLTGNTGAKLPSTSGYSASNPSGKQVYYGIREHAMGAAMVGMALHGGVIPVGGTFFVFADYMRPSIRLAALSKARCVFVFSHDSVGVGEDGPTHQPVEHLASLRAIPGLQVIRPADPNETAQAWLAAVAHNGPTAIILSRQNVPSLTKGEAVQPGASVIHRSTAPVATIIATGSELGVAVDAAKKLGDENIQVNVVSMPSWDRFMKLSKNDRDAILPPTMPRVSVEAGTTFGWAAFATHSVGIDRFGASAPGNLVMDKLGINVPNVVSVTKAALAE